MLKQMQKMLQESLTRIQEELATLSVEGVAGGGMVKVSMSGKQEILAVEIEPSVINPGEKEVLEDLVLVAVKDAIAKSQALAAEKMSQFTGGLSIPGLF